MAVGNNMENGARSGFPANRSRDWRPYTVGRWAYTDDWGWYWISDDSEASWGTVTFHYGRWIFDDDIGWSWVAGNEWAPAWVSWRRGRGQQAQYVGWAPLPPDEVVVEYYRAAAVLGLCARTRLRCAEDRIRHPSSA